MQVEYATSAAPARDAQLGLPTACNNAPGTAAELLHGAEPSSSRPDVASSDAEAAAGTAANQDQLSGSGRTAVQRESGPAVPAATEPAPDILGKALAGRGSPKRGTAAADPQQQPGGQADHAANAAALAAVGVNLGPPTAQELSRSQLPAAAAASGSSDTAPQVANGHANGALHGTAAALAAAKRALALKPGSLRPPRTGASRLGCIVTSLVSVEGEDLCRLRARGMKKGRMLHRHGV